MRFITFLFLLGILATAPCFAQTLPAPATLSATSLDSIIQLLSGKKQYSKALPYAQMLLQKTEEQYTKNDTHYVKNGLLLGELYYSLSKYDLAKKEILTAQNIQEKTQGKENNLYLDASYSLLAVYAQLNQPQQAEQLLEQNIALEEKMGSDSLLIYENFRVSFLNFHFRLNQHEECEKILLIVLQYWAKKENKMHIRYTDALGSLASTYLQWGRRQEGEQLYLQLLDTQAKIAKETGVISEDYLQNLWVFGMFCVSNKKYDEGKKYLEKAQLLCQKSLGTNNETYAWIRLKTADLYRATGKNEAAILIYKDALSIFEKNGGKKGQGYSFSLNNMAAAHSNLGQFDKAEILLEEALAVKEAYYGRKHVEYAWTLGTIAELCLKKKDLNRALLYTLRNFAANSTAWDTIATLSDDFIKQIATAHYLSKGRAFVALNHLLAILEGQYQQTKDLAYTQKAYYVSEAALKLSERFKNELSTEQDKFATLKTHNGFAQQGILNSYRLSQQQSKSEYLEAAFSFAEQNKAVVLADAIKANRARQMSDIPETLAEQELALQQELGALQKQLLEIKDNAKKTDIRERFTQKSKELEDLKQQLEKNYPQYYAIKYSVSTANIQQIQHILPEKTALLAYQVGDSTTYIFAITKTSFSIVPSQISLQKINDQTEILRTNLSDYNFLKENPQLSYQQFTDVSHWFYTALVQPALAKCPNTEQLIIVPDNSLGHLPFEVFLVEPAAKEGDRSYEKLHYLLRDYRVSYSYSATLWLENMKAVSKATTNQFLGMAASYQNSANLETLPRSRQQQILRSGVSDLPQAMQEVKELEKLFAGTYFYAQEAGEANFKKNAANANIIHLAMHGVLNQKNPILSSLVLTENGDTVEDNFLEAWEIAHLKLNADLVVLSACETGFGQFQQGEGVMSLGRAFMLAGVPSLVISLWAVNDQSTAFIMKSFYQQLKQQHNKAHALQQAKLDYLKNSSGIAAHPAFWAPFVQLGNSCPIQLGQANVSWIWWLSGGSFALMFGALVWTVRMKKDKLV